MKEKNNIVSSSLVLLIMFNIFNLLNLLFQIFVAHKLEVAEYGIFTALFSFVYIFAIFAESVQLVATKQSAKSNSLNNTSRIYNSAMSSSRWLALFLFIVYVLVFAIGNNAFQIPFLLILLNGVSVFFILSGAVIRGILQGQKRFFDLGLNMISEGLAKLLLGVLFIFVGWKIYGVLGAVIISMIVPIIYGKFSQIRVISSYNNKKSSSKESIFDFFQPKVMAIMASIMLCFMVDVLIARAVLSPELAGYYAIASTIAKMAFIGTQPISKAMLSYVVNSKNNTDSRKIFIKSLSVLIIVLLIGVIIALFFSNIIVTLFGGTDKIMSATILPIVLIALSLMSLANLVIFYKIAKDKINLFWVLPIALVLIVLILFLSPPTLIGFALSYLLGTIIFLIASLLVTK